MGKFNEVILVKQLAVVLYVNLNLKLGDICRNKMM